MIVLWQYIACRLQWEFAGYCHSIYAINWNYASWLHQITSWVATDLPPHQHRPWPLVQGGGSTTASTLSGPHPRGGSSSSLPVEGWRGHTRRGINKQLSTSPSQLLGRRATQERVIVKLELEVEELREKCSTCRETVVELRSENAKLMVKEGCTKKAMRKSLQ